MVLIGAGALQITSKGFDRPTFDVDVTIEVSAKEATERLDRVADWRLDPRIEHAWTSPSGVRVDILPISEADLERGDVAWSGTGRRMSLVGFRHAFASTHREDLGGGCSIRVASPDVVGLLKIVAYLENPEREKDLADLALLLEQYVGDSDERRFDPEVIAEHISYESVGAYFFGKDLASISGEPEREIILDFVDRLQGRGDGGFMAATILRNGPIAWRVRPEEFEDRVLAFRRGLGES